MWVGLLPDKYDNEGFYFQARDFRDFWGEISQLRRFKDGSICEAVAWLESNAEISKRRMVCSKVVTHILQRY